MIFDIQRMTGMLRAPHVHSNFLPPTTHKPLPPSRVLDHKAKQTWSIAEGPAMWHDQKGRCSHDQNATLFGFSNHGSVSRTFFGWFLAGHCLASWDDHEFGRFHAPKTPLPKGTGSQRGPVRWSVFGWGYMTTFLKIM